jgi:O-methyltransferase
MQDRENLLNKIVHFHNEMIETNIINKEQISTLVDKLCEVIENNIDGDVVELGCYVGESSKYLTKTILETQSNKKLFVYDSFEGLPDLSDWEINSGWQPRTLNTTEEILIKNFKQNNLPIPIIHKDWFKNIPDYKIPEKICFAFLDGDFYDSIYDSLTKVYDNVTTGGYIFFHDYKRHDLPGVEAAVKQFLNEKNINQPIHEITKELAYIIKGEKGELIDQLPQLDNII